MATQNGNIEVVKTLLSHQDIDVNSLIIFASIFSHNFLFNFSIMFQNSLFLKQHFNS